MPEDDERSFPMSTDTNLDDVLATIKIYFDGLHTSDCALLRSAFHPLSTVIGYGSDGELKTMTLDDFLASSTPYRRRKPAGSNSICLCSLLIEAVRLPRLRCTIIILAGILSITCILLKPPMGGKLPPRLFIPMPEADQGL